MCEFEAFMVVVIKVPFLWYVTPCNSSFALFRPLVLVVLLVFLLLSYVRIFLYHAGGGSICLRNLTLYFSLIKDFDNFIAVPYGRRFILEHH
jgi:hypothetical protein